MLDGQQQVLTITIPTYNRVQFLEKNLLQLEQMIFELNVAEKVGILVMDNGSTDGTDELFSNDAKWKIRIQYRRNKENIGPIKNIANLFGMVDSKYMMLLGDDDFITKEYLQRVLECLEEEIGCIIPSYVNVDLNGKEIGRGRDLDVSSSEYEAGFSNCLENAWRGHQLSGLVYKVSGIMEQIEEKDIYNYYLQIYAVAYCCLHGKTYHITEYPIRVTRPPQKNKAWGYGDDGLIGDVFSNFVKLDISNFEKMKLEMKFLTDQYWRYAMYLKKGIGKFFGCIAKVIKSPNTVWPTKIIFACSFLFILGWKAISLLFSGKLWKTLSTKVDI